MRLLRATIQASPDLGPGRAKICKSSILAPVSRYSARFGSGFYLLVQATPLLCGAVATTPWIQAPLAILSENCLFALQLQLQQWAPNTT